MLRNEWNKELESPILSRQCENVLTSIIRVTMDLILQLIKQKIVFKIYWTLFHLYRKQLSRTAFYWRCNKGNASLEHICTIVDYINIIVQQNLKFSDNIFLNYVVLGI